jgi:hypothetical protein
MNICRARRSFAGIAVDGVPCLARAGAAQVTQTKSAHSSALVVRRVPNLTRSRARGRLTPTTSTNSERALARLRCCASAIRIGNCAPSRADRQRAQSFAGLLQIGHEPRDAIFSLFSHHMPSFRSIGNETADSPLRSIAAVQTFCWTIATFVASDCLRQCAGRWLDSAA